MLFKPKEIYKYNILEKIKIDIEEEKRLAHNACELVNERTRWWM